MVLQETALLARGRLSTGCPRDDRALTLALRQLGPKLLQRRGHVATLLAPGEIGNDARQLRVRLCTARFRMCPRLQHQERAGRTKREAGMILARPHGGELVLQVEVAEFVEDEQVLALAIVRAADQRDVALARGDARQRDTGGIGAGNLFAHEGARGAAKSMHDGDVAGEQVGELRQEQSGAQIAHQPFVEEAGRVRPLGLGGKHAGVDIEIALAAAGGHHHVDLRQDILVALDPGGIERKASGIGADALPGFHLALVALLRDLAVEGNRHQGMHDVGCKTLLVDIDALLLKRGPIGVQALAERGGQSNAGDPDLGLAWLRRGSVSHGDRACCGKPTRSATFAMYPRISALGKGISVKVSAELARSLPPTLILASVMA